MKEPWLLAGDFNETCFPSERSSSCRETTRQSGHFNTLIDELELIEIAFSGPQHTWTRGYPLKLDKVLVWIGPYAMGLGD